MAEQEEAYSIKPHELVSQVNSMGFHFDLEYLFGRHLSTSEAVTDFKISRSEVFIKFYR